MTISKRVPLLIAATAILANGAIGAEVFRHTITGEELKVLEQAPPEGRDTPAVKKFLEDGLNGYNEVKACLPKGEEAYLVACSGCHGHVGEGKVGPGLNDNYWTYPKNTTDKGLYETIFGGAQGMMGPHSDLQIDETLKLMAWIRHLYVGEPSTAEWLTPEQQKTFKPYKAEVHADPAAAEAEAEKKVAAAAEKKSAEGDKPAADGDQCKISGG